MKKILLLAVCSFSALVSSHTFGQHLLPCNDDPEQTYYTIKSYENQNNDNVKLQLGLSILCLNHDQRSKVSQSFDSGIEHIKYAADRNNILGLYFLAMSEKTDGYFDFSTSNNVQKLRNAIQYLKHAINSIENNSMYPKNETNMTIEFEKTKKTLPISLKIFREINYLYRAKYIKELWADRDRHKEERTQLSYYTTNLLFNLAKMSQKCLDFNRPEVISYWHQKEKMIYFKNTECGASLDFITKIFPLEKERWTVAKNCQSDKLKDCKKYIAVENKIKVVIGGEL